MGKHGVVDASRVQLPYHCYMDGETITNPDNWKVPLPTQTTVVQIEAEDGECHYAIDGNFAQDNSPGYIAADAGVKIGPIGGGSMQTLHIHAPTGIIHLQYFKECGRGRNERAGFQYYEKVLNLDPIAYWPLWETSGITAECLINNAQNGEYSSDVSTWPVGTGIGDGNTAPQLDGTNDYIQLLTAAGQVTLNAATTEGSAAIWFRVANVGVWTDGAFRSQYAFIDDASNRYNLYKSNANNTLYAIHYAGGTGETDTLGGQVATGWMHYVLTWSESADEVKYYLDGTLLNTDTTIGNWTGDGNWTSMLVGASSAAPGTPWHGWLAHMAIWNRALTQSDVSAMATA